MKKILFNNRYGLETAVIERRKTMTRLIVRALLKLQPDFDYKAIEQEAEKLHGKRIMAE